MRAGLGLTSVRMRGASRRVYLNTDTEVVPHYDKQTRRVELKTGEAMFEVSKHPDWPFIVSAGDRQVRALGTSFMVRREAEQLQ